MNTMASVLGVGLIFTVFTALVPMALLIVLQVWLCKKGKWLGVILPGLSLLMSLLLVFSLSAFQTVGTTGELTVIDANGQIIQQEHHGERNGEHSGMTPGAMGAVAGMFLVCNIPTVIFGGIWLHFKNRRDFQEDLNKMRLEDLE